MFGRLFCPTRAGHTVQNVTYFLAVLHSRWKYTSGPQDWKILSRVLPFEGHGRTWVLYLGRASGNAATGRSVQTHLDIPFGTNKFPLCWSLVYYLSSRGGGAGTECAQACSPHQTIQKWTSAKIQNYRHVLRFISKAFQKPCRAAQIHSGK